MPNRVLRDGILDSEAVNSLSFPAEVFFRRLMSAVDDFGRFDGRPAVLRSRLYALKVDTVREADISRWIAECEKAGVIALYAVDAKPYVLLRKVDPPRAKSSKYPAPPADAGACTHLRADAGTCGQTQADADECERVQADAGMCEHMRPYSYSDSDAGSNEEEDSSEPAKPPSSEPAVMMFPCAGTGPKEWPLTAPKLAEYRGAFPGVDVEAELRKALQWLRDNPGKKKTPAGMPRFLGSWLGRVQNGPRVGTAAVTIQHTDPAEAARRQRERIDKVNQPGGLWKGLAAKAGGGA